jgi:uncharacterized protein YmfQ (DUF2313 family)
MPVTLSDKARTMLADMPPYEADEPFVQAVIAAYANEFERIEDAAVAIQNALFPARAADVALPEIGVIARIMSMWESFLGLPVAPAGVSVTERRNKINAHIRKRHSAEGADWVANLTEAIGATPWTYQEGPGDYVVTLHIPFDSTSYSASQMMALAREMTPAHLDVVPVFNEGFLVGISLVGVEPL